jgi:uncharacterized protein
MSQPDFEQAKQYALARLERESSPNLVYHSPGHTRDDVLPAAERLAALEGVTAEDRLLLLTAAAYHDLGFLEQYTDNESIGVRIASEALPQFGYTPEQIRTIGHIIMATRLPQSPQTHLEEIMADADLDILGRDDFMRHNQTLRDELSAFGCPSSDEGWYSYQLQFLQAHRYFTTAAQSLRGARKQQNIETLAALLARYRA